MRESFNEATVSKCLCTFGNGNPDETQDAILQLGKKLLTSENRFFDLVRSKARNELFSHHLFKFLGSSIFNFEKMNRSSFSKLSSHPVETLKRGIRDCDYRDNFFQFAAPPPKHKDDF